MTEINWNAENAREICKLFAEQVGRGNHPNTCLNSVGYVEIKKGLKDMVGIVTTKT